MATQSPLRRILIVDPSADVRDGLNEALASLNVEVRQTADGFHAVQLVREWHADAVLAGTRLADMSGATLCKLIKSDPRSTHVVVLLQANLYLSMESLLEGMYAGAEAVFCWPMPREEFQEKLAHVLSHFFQLESEAA